MMIRGSEEREFTRITRKRDPETEVDKGEWTLRERGLGSNRLVEWRYFSDELEWRFYSG